MESECKKCSGKGTYRSMDIVEGSKVIVKVPCPVCSKGKHIESSQLDFEPKSKIDLFLMED